jgi:hypothetical protein
MRSLYNPGRWLADTAIFSRVSKEYPKLREPQLQPTREHLIDDTQLLLEECRDLGQDGIVVHHQLSTCASVVSVSGSQNVMSID